MTIILSAAAATASATDTESDYQQVDWICSLTSTHPSTSKYTYTDRLKPSTRQAKSAYADYRDKHTI